MADQARISIYMDPEVASILRARAAEAGVSEGEIVARAVRAFDLRSLVATVRGRSDLDEDSAMRLAREELRAARAGRADAA
jgi:lipoate synthase